MNMKSPVATLGHANPRYWETNKVIRNTYLLLSLTLVFSAMTAGASMALKPAPPGLIVTLVGYFGLLFLTANSKTVLLAWDSSSPSLASWLYPWTYHQQLPQLAQWQPVVMTAMGATAAVFPRSFRLRPDQPQEFQLHGWLPYGRHSSGLPGRSRCLVFRDARPVAGRLRHVRVADAGVILFETSNIIHRWRNQLHHGHRIAVRRHLQPVYQLVAPAGFCQQ